MRLLYQCLYAALSRFLEMMMQGSHFKYSSSFAVSLFRILEIGYLNHDRKRFGEEHAAKDRDKQLLMDDDAKGNRLSLR